MKINGRIGIIGAMKIEVAALCAAMENPVRETVSGVEYISGRLFGHDCVVACCGVGKVFAAICAQTMILRYQPALIVNTGVGGTLTERLSIGDIAVSSDVVQYDMDTSPLGDPVGLLSGINIIHIPADAHAAEALSRAADACGVRTVTGTVCSGDRFLCDPQIKTRIARDFGGVVCEMEGAAIGQVCYVNQTPFCVLRSVSDSADGDSPEDFALFTEKATENSVRVLRYFMEENAYA